MAEEGADDVKFIDAEQWSGGNEEKLTFREIVLVQVKKIGLNANCEFRGGYWLRKPHPNQSSNATVDEYIADTREVYSNSIDYLFDILFPHFDKEMQKAGQEYEQEQKQAFDDHSIINEPDDEDETSEQSAKCRKTFGTEQDKVCYRQERRKICRKLFRNLCCFLKRIDYFKGKIFEEEA